MKLESGRIETGVAKQKNSGARYEIRTPTSNMGVRGTMFRVGADESGKRGQGEVVEGLVAVTSSGTCWYQCVRGCGACVAGRLRLFCRSGKTTFAADRVVASA